MLSFLYHLVVFFHHPDQSAWRLVNVLLNLSNIHVPSLLLLYSLHMPVIAAAICSIWTCHVISTINCRSSLCCAGMDELMEVSFSPIAATGKPFSRCGKCHRYMKYIQVYTEPLITFFFLFFFLNEVWIQNRYTGQLTIHGVCLNDMKMHLSLAMTLYSTGRISGLQFINFFTKVSKAFNQNDVITLQKFMLPLTML